MSPRLVALRLPPGPAFAAALRRLWARGDAAAPLDPQAPEAATRSLLATLRPHELIDGDGAHRQDGGAPVEPGTALVIATSGYEKAVVLRHEALEASTAASVHRLGCEPGDRWLCCLPTHHVAGIQVLLRAWALGTEPVIHPRFDPAAVAAEPGVAYVSLVPTMLSRLLDAGADVARFSGVLLGGAAPPAGLLERARKAGARVVTTYGMTETCGGCVYDGLPLDGFDVRVGDDGRVRIRGAVCSGYRLRDDLTAAAFEGEWFVTSDRGAWRDGRLEVLGRVDDVVITGGENVDAEAVGQVLRDHPGIADAAAVGRPDPEWGQALIAYCVSEGTVRPSDDELAAHVRRALGRVAAPKAVRWVESIPRGPLGKVRRAALMRDDGGEQSQEER